MSDKTKQAIEELVEENRKRIKQLEALEDGPTCCHGTARVNQLRTLVEVNWRLVAILDLPEGE